jgi:hypothetical protein
MHALAGTTALFLIVFLSPSAGWSQSAECGPSPPGPGFTRSRPEPVFQNGGVFTKPALGRGFTYPRPASVDKFLLTKKVYPPDTDFDAAVKEEYGPNASVADWSDIAADLLTQKDAETFANSSGGAESPNGQPRGNRVVRVIRRAPRSIFPGVARLPTDYPTSALATKIFYGCQSIREEHSARWKNVSRF